MTIMDFISNDTLPTGNPALWSNLLTDGESISDALSNLSNICLS